MVSIFMILIYVNRCLRQGEAQKEVEQGRTLDSNYAAPGSLFLLFESPLGRKLESLVGKERSP